MSRRYAEGTSVPVEKSKMEIERLLTRYGAAQFFSGWDAEKAVIGFAYAGRQVRFTLPIPERDQFWTTPTGKPRTSDDAVDKAWEQAQRQSWRALALVIKAKLEAVEGGITSFEDEFLAHTVLPDGRRVGEAIAPAIEQAYLTGKAPPLLLGAGEGA